MSDEPSTPPPAAESKPAADPLTDPIPKGTTTPKPAETPAKTPESAPPAEPPKGKSIKEFTPEPFSMDQGTKAKEDPPSKPEVPPEPAPDAKKDDPAPEEGKPVEGSNLLREKLEAANSEKQTISTELAAIRAEKEALEAQIEELRGTSEETAAKLKEIEERRGLQDPAQHPEVVKLREERTKFERDFGNKIHRMASDMGGEEGAALWGATGEAFLHLVRQYDAVGQIGDEGYAERHAALKNDLEEKFPDNHRDVLKALREGSEALAQSLHMSKREEDLVKELSGKGAQIQSAEMQQAYERGIKLYDDTAKQWLNPMPDQVENHPHSPRVALKRLVDESEQVAQRWDAIKKMLRQGLAPIAPLSAEQLGAMSEEDAQAYMQKRLGERQTILTRLQNTAGEAYLSHAILPSILEERDELRAELDALRDGTPSPKPHQPGDQEKKTEEQKSIKEFVPQNDLLAEATARR